MSAEGKLVIITGGTKGLGRAMSLEFGKAGFHVVAVYRSDAAAAAELKEEFARREIRGETIQFDVCQEGFEEAVLSRPSLAQFTDLVLINNAVSNFRHMPFHKLTWAEFETAHQTLVKGAYLCSKAVLPRMAKAGRGTIVTILTKAVSGMPPKGMAAYVTAKYGVMGLMKALEAEYGARGIRIMTVSPGFMDTPLTRAWEPLLRNAILAAGQTDDPETVARSVLDQVLGSC